MGQNLKQRPLPTLPEKTQGAETMKGGSRWWWRDWRVSQPCTHQVGDSYTVDLGLAPCSGCCDLMHGVAMLLRFCGGEAGWCCDPVCQVLPLTQVWSGDHFLVNLSGTAAQCCRLQWHSVGRGGEVPWGKLSLLPPSASWTAVEICGLGEREKTVL